MLKREEFKSNASTVIEWIDQYFQNLETYPVKSQVRPNEVYNQLPQVPPQKGEPLKAIINDLDSVILPGITHWQHPNFHAYFPANSSVESLFAEFITAAIAAQCMIWDTSPAAAELEQRTMEWLRNSMGIPSHFEGVIQDSASSATLVAILTAREVSSNFKATHDGVPSNLRVYCSTQTHSSIDKAVGISGIGTKNLVKISVDDQLRLDPKALERQIKKDMRHGCKPCCVVASVGTTGTVAVDPVKDIADICEKYNIWLHIDAAYAGTALLLPEYQWMVEGVEKADSFVFNPHKWMFTNFDCSVYFVKNAAILIKTFEVLPEYLKTMTRGQVNDYRDWGLPLGRRFRALKFWFVIRSYGIQGIKGRIRQHIALNQYFASTIAKQPGFELMIEPFLNFTGFRYKPNALATLGQINAQNELLLDQLNKSGELFLSHTKIGDQYTLRMIIGQTYVEKPHIDKAIDVITKTAGNLQSKS